MQYYIDGLASSPEALHGSFQLYRAFGATAVQNEERKTRRLPMPVLAIGGDHSYGASMQSELAYVASNVRGAVITNSGHWIMEEQPQQAIGVILPFIESK